MFPLHKRTLLLNNETDSFLDEYDNVAEIPIAPHPGAFGVERKNHIHEGVDLYCEPGDPVYSMYVGTIVHIGPFTGPAAGSPWWRDTQCIMVWHVGKEYCCINYGEIIVDPSLRVGDAVAEGQVLGNVETVLRLDKGRPMTMLHLEKYYWACHKPVSEWAKGTPRPEHLEDPTPLLMKYLKG